MWDEDTALRRRLAEEPQAPIAATLGCCDSRVPGNLIFDQELGRLFPVQVAGGMLGPHALASLEFAVESLGVPLVIALGHTQCGALQAVVEAGGRPLPGSLGSIQDEFGALLERHPQHPKESAPAYALRLARLNARRQASRLLEQSDLLRASSQAGRCMIASAVYHLETGRVHLENGTL